MPAESRRPVCWPRIVLWLFAGVLAACSLSRVAAVSWDQLAAPFDLISEGPHMTTVKAFREGYNIYDPASFLDVPFFMTPYTPLYHAVVAALPQRSSNPFFTGRLVALAFMAGSAASLFAVARRRAHVPLALIAVAVFFLMRPVTGNTAYLRSDSTALFFSVWGVVCAARVSSRSRSVIVPALLCTAGFAAKQSFVAAGGACFVYFLLRERQRAAVFLAAASACAGVLALAAWWYWGDGFWLAVTIPMTDYPRDWDSFVVHWHLMLQQPVFVLLVIVAAGVLVSVIYEAPGLVSGSPYFAYAVFAWAAQTWVLTGIGAENHNLIEPVLATLLWMIAIRSEMKVDSGLDWRHATILGALAVCTAGELLYARRPDYSYTTSAKTEKYVRDRAQITAALRALGLEHGRMLNLKNSQVTHDFDGQMNVNDPWMYITVLWQSRPETAARLLRAIEGQYFDAVLVAPGLTSARGQTLDNATQHIIRTVFQHYELKVRGGEVNVLTRIGGRAIR